MATIRDVAKESGVSVATVSYVLNNGPRQVGASTKERVLSVVRRLNYHPNATARRLAGRQMRTIGVLFGYVGPDILTNPFAATILQGVLSAAARVHYNVTLFTSVWETAETSAVEFTDGRTDGVLVIGPLVGSDMIPGLSALGIPVVCVSGPSETPGVPFIDVDNETGARLATKHLIGLGHTRIAHIGGRRTHADAIVRRDVFLRTMENAGLHVPESYLPEGSYEWTRVPSIIRAVLTHPIRPTAIFAGNDILAVECLKEARLLGLRVPEDLSIVGFDDLPIAQHVSPPLTTICQPLTEIGSMGMELLVQRIQASEKNGAAVTMAVDAQGGILQQPELILRGSTCPPSILDHTPKFG